MISLNILAGSLCCVERTAEQGQEEGDWLGHYCSNPTQDDRGLDGNGNCRGVKRRENRALILQEGSTELACG